jgi:hypothetical protein
MQCIELKSKLKLNLSLDHSWSSFRLDWHAAFTLGDALMHWAQDRQNYGPSHPVQDSLYFASRIGRRIDINYLQIS